MCGVGRCVCVWQMKTVDVTDVTSSSKVSQSSIVKITFH